MSDETILTKLTWNLPWLVRYPFERVRNFLGRSAFGKKHVIFTVADHFEPAWSPSGALGLDDQKRALEAYHELARRTGESTRDADGTKFRHTNFYPAEQYERSLLERLAAMQAEGLGEVEVHLHHGIDEPDTADGLRRQLVEFRDALAGEHRCLSRLDGRGGPRYAFVHGNLALANSAGGRFCGVDEEMKILAETGCYADLTLPSAPDRTQVPMFNKIYECGRPLDERMPHRTGKSVRADGNSPRLPLIFTGPLIFNWTRRIRGLPVPRLDDGALAANQPLDGARFGRWMNADITVRGRPEWVFIKLYCHGFFGHDQSACIGEEAARFFGEIVEEGARTGRYTVHFASAREAVNMILAAVDGKKGDPHGFRDYRLRTIMSGAPAGPESEDREQKVMVRS